MNHSFILGNQQLSESFISILAMIGLIGAIISEIPSPLPLYLIVQNFIPVKNEKIPYCCIVMWFPVF